MRKEMGAIIAVDHCVDRVLVGGSVCVGGVWEDYLVHNGAGGDNIYIYIYIIRRQYRARKH